MYVWWPQCHILSRCKRQKKKYIYVVCLNFVLMQTAICALLHFDHNLCDLMIQSGARKSNPAKERGVALQFLAAASVVTWSQQPRGHHCCPRGLFLLPLTLRPDHFLVRHFVEENERVKNICRLSITNLSAVTRNFFFRKEMCCYFPHCGVSRTWMLRGDRHEGT